MPKALKVYNSFSVQEKKKVIHVNSPITVYKGMYKEVSIITPNEVAQSGEVEGNL